MLPGDEPEYLSPIEPRSLIRHARRRLEAADADATDYRRAVSDAFYALYHALTLAAAPYVASATDDPLEPYRQLRRIRHRHVRTAADAMMGSANERVRMVAEAMHYLYGWRAAADYDHLVRFPRPRVVDLINRADEAVGAVAETGFGDAFPRRLATLP